MGPKIFLGFGGVTAVVVIAAGVSISARYGAATSGVAEESVFAGLAGQFEDIGEIAVQDKDKTLTIKRAGDTWLVSNRSAYPASAEAVRDVLIGLSELRLKEGKTEKRALYAKLSVEDVTEKDAKSRLLTVRRKDGTVLASLIVGRETDQIAGASDVGRYIRKPGEAQSWLAEGRLRVPAAVKDWVTPQFLDVPNKRIAAVNVVHPDGHLMDVKRENKSGKRFLIQNMPAERKVEYQSDIDNMGDGLDKLELEDVRAAGKIQFPKDKTIKTTIRTFDGLLVTVESFEDKDTKFWGRFNAAAAPGAAATVKKEAAQINEITQKWVYELPAHKFRYLSRKQDDVLEVVKKDSDKK